MEIEQLLMFFINTLYQSILSWMALGLASLIGIIEVGKFKKKSVKMVLFLVLILAVTISLFKVYDHWNWVVIYRKGLENYTNNKQFWSKGKIYNLTFPNPGNLVTRKFNIFLNFLFRFPISAFVLFSIFIFLLIGCILYEEYDWNLLKDNEKLNNRVNFSFIKKRMFDLQKKIPQAKTLESLVFRALILVVIIIIGLNGFKWKNGVLTFSDWWNFKAGEVMQYTVIILFGLATWRIAKETKLNRQQKDRPLIVSEMGPSRVIILNVGERMAIIRSGQIKDITSGETLHHIPQGMWLFPAHKEIPENQRFSIKFGFNTREDHEIKVSVKYEDPLNGKLETFLRSQKV